MKTMGRGTAAVRNCPGRERGDQYTEDPESAFTLVGPLAAVLGLLQVAVNLVPDLTVFLATSSVPPAWPPMLYVPCTYVISV
jgi:hypothetical protein